MTDDEQIQRLVVELPSGPFSLEKPVPELSQQGGQLIPGEVRRGRALAQAPELLLMSGHGPDVAPCN